jgi:hypothetical protein
MRRCGHAQPSWAGDRSGRRGLGGEVSTIKISEIPGAARQASCLIYSWIGTLDWRRNLGVEEDGRSPSPQPSPRASRREVRKTITNKIMIKIKKRSLYPRFRGQKYEIWVRGTLLRGETEPLRNFPVDLRASRGVTAMGDSPSEPRANLARPHNDGAENNSPAPSGPAIFDRGARGKEFFRPCRDWFHYFSQPSVKTLGYYRSSLRDFSRLWDGLFKSV